MDDRKLSAWKLIGASVRGRSHALTNTRCQDAVRYESHNGVALAAVSDGAGSAALAHLGASIATETALETLRATIPERALTLRDVQDAFAAARAAIVSDADDRSRSTRDYACTLLVVVADDERTLVGQIGDGAIVGVPFEEDLKVIGWPQQGDYANSTFFLCEETSEPVFVEEAPLEAFSMLSDGLQMVALEYEHLRAHAPFFRPFFAALRDATMPLEELEQHLATYLETDPTLAERTDDDLSLLVAVRA
jgi:hypothetical protein